MAGFGVATEATRTEPIVNRNIVTFSSSSQNEGWVQSSRALAPTLGAELYSNDYRL
jgi:hypothetical protein